MSELVVYGVAGIGGLASGSPFVLKLLTWLRMAELPHRYEVLARPPRSRTGKVPYVHLPDGSLLEDSQVIVEHLAAAHGIELDAGLDPSQRALAHLLRRTIEDGLYWPLLWERWCTEPGFAVVRDSYFDNVPAPLRGLVAGAIRRQVIRQATQQGIHKRPADQVLAIAAADLATLATVLGDQEWLLGRPHLVDAVAYGTLAQVLAQAEDSPLRARLQAHPRLVAYVGRVADRYWPAG